MPTLRELIEDLIRERPYSTYNQTWGHYECTPSFAQRRQITPSTRSVSQLFDMPYSIEVLRFIHNDIIDSYKKNDVGTYLVCIKGTRGENNSNFSSKVSEKSFETLLKRIPSDENVVFFDKYGNIIKAVINNES